VRAHVDAHVSCILVGNKVDLCEGEDARERAVPTAEAALWAK
jgi:Ras-related protein Rab-2A